MKLTKKFIKENAEMTLKEAFPEVFETFTGWMISNGNGWLGYFEKNILKYGLVDEFWFLSSKAIIVKTVNCDRPATPQEIKDALEKEAVRRYPKECTVKDLSGEIKKLYLQRYYDYYLEANDLYFCGLLMFKNGQWATIIPTITKQEAEERLGVKII